MMEKSYGIVFGTAYETEYKEQLGNMPCNTLYYAAFMQCCKLCNESDRF